MKSWCFLFLTFTLFIQSCYCDGKNQDSDLQEEPTIFALCLPDQREEKSDMTNSPKFLMFTAPLVNYHKSLLDCATQHSKDKIKEEKKTLTCPCSTDVTKPTDHKTVETTYSHDSSNLKRESHEYSKKDIDSSKKDQQHLYKQQSHDTSQNQKSKNIHIMKKCCNDLLKTLNHNDRPMQVPKSHNRVHHYRLPKNSSLYKNQSQDASKNLKLSKNDRSSTVQKYSLPCVDYCERFHKSHKINSKKSNYDHDIFKNHRIRKQHGKDSLKDHQHSMKGHSQDYSKQIRSPHRKQYRSLKRRPQDRCHMKCQPHYYPVKVHSQHHHKNLRSSKKNHQDSYKDHRVKCQPHSYPAAHHPHRGKNHRSYKECHQDSYKDHHLVKCHPHDHPVRVHYPRREHRLRKKIHPDSYDDRSRKTIRKIIPKVDTHTGSKVPSTPAIDPHTRILFNASPRIAV